MGLLDLFRRAPPPPIRCVNAWGVMLGQTHLAASTGDEGNALVSIFLVDPQIPARSPRTAIWQTRSAAREAAVKLRSDWPKARAVRLRITIAIA